MNVSRRIRRRFGAVLLAGLGTQACSDSPSASSHTSFSMQTETLPTTAAVYTTVAPAVTVRDQAGRPLQGATVTFQVAEGGGTLASGAVVTGADGRATAEWRLGSAAGTNRLTAQVSATQRATFTVQAVAGPASAMTVAMAAPEAAPVSGLTGIVPAVRITDAHGNAVAGVAVAFQVTAGGGQVEPGAGTTDATGVAAPARWTMGPEPGMNELTATVAGLTPVTFRTEAVAVSSGLLTLAAFAGDDTTCPVNTADCRFTVRVTGPTGAGVQGQTVFWTGPGGVTGTTITNRSGFSTSPNLGTQQTGSWTQTARLPLGAEEARFSYRIVPGGGFGLDVRFVGDVSPGIRASFERSRARWQQIITGNLPEFPLTGSNQVAANSCGINHPAVNETVDDILIFVEVVSIDGPGKVLGSAGPCLIRGGNGLPILGVIKLDLDDLEPMAGNGTLDDVILHEMGHVLGLGTLWARRSLVEGAGSADPYYTGPRAQPGFVLGGGSILNGVPVENTGGTGTRDSHWRESRLGNELMTGYIGGTANPLSSITIGALMDLGYQVNFGAADAYVLPGQLASMQAATHRIELHEVPLPPPLTVWQ
ncbi:MAG TPA: leishmanolysin-related zinc metalloendopeptidase [Longimicrobiales bacterium]|nr:leishmanolysin-related zinc metalloendopeptidase [Longimicrobiales bacterium]